MLKKIVLCLGLLWNQTGEAATVAELYQEAESAWSQGNLPESQMHFEQIENTYPLKAGWSAEELRLFRLSFLRLAQLSEKRELREQRLIKAYSISSDVGDEDHMFPKELISDLQSMKGKLPLGFNRSEMPSQTSKTSSSFVPSKTSWIIIGVTALVAGVTYSLLSKGSSQESKSTVVPGSVEGFK